jgi:hypothetical protein
MEYCPDGVFARSNHGSNLTNLGHLNLSHDTQNVVLALEVVEECSFTHVGGFCDVFHGDILEAALGEKLESTTKQAQAGFSGASLAATRTRGMVDRGRRQRTSGCRVNVFMTIVHYRPQFIYDYQSYLIFQSISVKP